jgi:hypothetical protein
MPSTGPSALSEVGVQGGAVTSFGSNAVSPATDGTTVVWYDSHQLHFMEYGLRSHRLVELQIGIWQDIRSEFALCGSRLFFALPAALDGGSSTIRYVELSVGV